MGGMSDIGTASDLAVSRACSAAGDLTGAIEAARRAVSHAPDDPEAIHELAIALYRGGGAYMRESRIVFERLIARQPDNTEALGQLYVLSLLEGDYGSALGFARRWLDACPGLPQANIAVVRAHLALGNTDAAQTCAKQALFKLREEALAIQGHRAVTEFEPLLEALAGDMPAARRASFRFCEFHAHFSGASTHAPDDTEALDRIAQLRAQVRGRDIYLFGRGPSLRDLSGSRIFSGLGGIAVCINEFGFTADQLLTPAGIPVGAVCFTNAAVLDSQRALLQAIAHRPEFMGAFLVSLDEIRRIASAMIAAAEIKARQIITFHGTSEFALPAPGHSLRMPAINTLGMALGMVTLLEPRRIFLFGFDGRATGPTEAIGSLYFGESEKLPVIADSARVFTAGYLWWDSFRFNQIAESMLYHLAILHGIQLPVIYNVCPSSGITVFPRISIDDFKCMSS